MSGFINSDDLLDIPEKKDEMQAVDVDLGRCILRISNRQNRQGENVPQVYLHQVDEDGKTRMNGDYERKFHVPNTPKGYRSQYGGCNDWVFKNGFIAKAHTLVLKQLGINPDGSQVLSGSSNDDDQNPY